MISVLLSDFPSQLEASVDRNHPRIHPHDSARSLIGYCVVTQRCPCSIVAQACSELNSSLRSFLESRSDISEVFVWLLERCHHCLKLGSHPKIQLTCTRQSKQTTACILQMNTLVLRGFVAWKQVSFLPPPSQVTFPQRVTFQLKGSVRMVAWVAYCE